MIKHFLLTLFMSGITTVSCFAGEEEKEVACISGKWKITEAKYQKHVSMQNITKVKKSNQRGKEIAALVKDGIIEFDDNMQQIKFIPAGDTAVYVGKVSYKEYSSFSGSGSSRSYGYAGSEMVIKFTGKGAKYNFAMMHDCPSKRKPNVFTGHTYDRFSNFRFERVQE